MDGSFEKQISSNNNKRIFTSNKNIETKPNLFETDDGKEYVNKNFNDSLEQNTIKRYFRYSDKEAVYAKRYKTTIIKLSKKTRLSNGKC